MKSQFLVVSVKDAAKHVIEKVGRRFLPIRVNQDTICFGAAHGSFDDAIKSIKQGYFDAGEYCIFETVIQQGQEHLFIKYAIEVDGGNLWNDFPGLLEIVDSVNYTKK